MKLIISYGVLMLLSKKITDRYYTGYNCTCIHIVWQMAVGDWLNHGVTGLHVV